MLPDVGARIVGFFLLTSLLVACAGAPSRPDAGATASSHAPAEGYDCTNFCRGTPRRTGSFDMASVPEASGLAVSARDHQVLWLVDDGDDVDTLWAVRQDGSTAGRLHVEGMDAVNAEALAAGPCGPGDPDPCLYVGDIGDNVGARDHVRVLRVREPVLEGVAVNAAADVIALRYPEGPRDAEALLVDQQGVPYLVSKAEVDANTGVTGPTRLWAAPGFRDGLLLDLGEVPVPEPPTPVVTLLYGNTVTGADSTEDRVLLRTYDQIVEYVSPMPGADLSTFPTWPHGRVTTTWLPQAEAVAYAADGCGYWSVSEGSGDIWLVPCEDGDTEEDA